MPIVFDGLAYDIPLTLVILVIGYGGLLLTSGFAVRAAFHVAKVTIADGQDQEDTGRAIGKLENVLVLSLMLVEAYTALGLIFAAKSIVRRADMSTGDTSYYLTGTVANFTYTVVIGLLLHGLLWAIVEFHV